LAAFEEIAMESPALFSPEWWQQPLGTWMAWTPATAAFFIYIFASIAAMGAWEYFSPGGNPRRGVFGLDTTRGDRLFMTNLGSCFIFLAWLGFFGAPLWGALFTAVIWAIFVFKFA
jgi:predicted small integral membrane protein